MGAVSSPRARDPSAGRDLPGGRNTYTGVDIRTWVASVRPGRPCTPTFPETQGHRQCLPDRGTQLPLRRKFQAFPTSGTHSRGRVCPAQLQEPRGHAGGSEGLPGAGRGWAGPGPLCGAWGRDGEAQRGSSSVGRAQAPRTCWPWKRPSRAPADHVAPPRCRSAGQVLLSTCISCL